MASRFVALLAALLLNSALAESADRSPVEDNGDRSADTTCQTVTEDLRRRPGEAKPSREYCIPSGLRPAVWDGLPEFAAIPDRWRIVTALGYPERWWDPYNGNNVFKGDRPAFGDDWFFAANIISDSTYEDRRIPTPVAIPTSPNPGTLDQLGNPDQRHSSRRT